MQRTTLATYDELLTALMESRRLFIAASLTDCGHPLPPEVYLAEGGSTYYYFYVVPGEAGEDVLVVEYPGFALSETGETTVVIMNRFFVSRDGSVSVKINHYNSFTWEDEYPFPEGFQCVLGESARFRYDSGDTYDSFSSYSELETAFSEGKHIRASFDSSGCVSPNDTIPDIAGERTYLLTLPCVSDLKIDLISWRSFHDLEKTELTDYSEVVQAELDGAVMSIMLDLDECVDPTGQLDLSGSVFGSYFQDVVILDPDTAEAVLYGGAGVSTSDPVSGIAYIFFGVMIEASNNAVILPGYWHFNENGEWVNDYGDAILECSLGGGVTIIREA
ncbi:unnamed protein product [Darwinula stevensoni]|uniref:Uncharacterized protein n=1 Tax=Darwinula stevensoni TaxID=69355 RepID=A0A7R8XF90_9CRUS|nr:unnamed protein product [Darwinula stevensoni]CAG0890458.1 unnamed protein product [Darwinula stevensoni]